MVQETATKVHHRLVVAEEEQELLVQVIVIQEMVVQEPMHTPHGLLRLTLEHRVITPAEVVLVLTQVHRVVVPEVVEVRMQAAVVVRVVYYTQLLL